MVDLLKQDQKWTWDVHCEEEFEKLKDVVAVELVLRLSVSDKLFEVQTDASAKAIGGVLV